MPTFRLTPDIQVINRYIDYTNKIPKNEQSIFKPITIYIDWIELNEKEFENSLKELLIKYRLEAHHDNILYLAFLMHNNVWETIDWYYQDYTSKKRAKELAKLLIMLFETKTGKLSEIIFKSFNVTAKTNDIVINDWISDTLIKAVENREFPIGAFGDTVLQMLSGKDDFLASQLLDIITLKKYADKRLIHPRNQIKKGIATIGFTIYSFLQNETTLQAPENIVFSDAQLNFLFDFLELLKQVNHLKIDSEPKDYLRTMLTNYIKT